MINKDTRNILACRCRIKFRCKSQTQRECLNVREKCPVMLVKISNKALSLHNHNTRYNFSVRNSNEGRTLTFSHDCFFFFSWESKSESHDGHPSIVHHMIWEEADMGGIGRHIPKRWWLPVRSQTLEVSYSVRGCCVHYICTSLIDKVKSKALLTSHLLLSSTDWFRYFSHRCNVASAIFHRHFSW